MGIGSVAQAVGEAVSRPELIGPMSQLPAVPEALGELVTETANVIGGGNLFTKILALLPKLILPISLAAGPIGHLVGTGLTGAMGVIGQGAASLESLASGGTVLTNVTAALTNLGSKIGIDKIVNFVTTGLGGITAPN